MLRVAIILLSLSSCSIFRSAENTSVGDGGQAASSDTLRIAVTIPPDCIPGNYEIEIEGKILGMHRPGEEAVYISRQAAEHFVIVRRKTKSWKQTLRPQTGQREWLVKVPCDSLR